MRTVVGVLRGGPSSEYEVSLLSGANVLAELDKSKYDARDIFIDRQGAWHSRGLEGSPEKALTGIDVVFNTIHGQYGEDGQLHRVLEPLGIPYTGADKLASALAFNKAHTKDAVVKLGVKVAHGRVVDLSERDIESMAHELFRTFPHPAVVKPVIGGSSVGVSIADNFHSLQHALEHAAQISPKVLVEEFIKGKEATVGVIDQFRGQEVYALMPVEIVPPQGKFFDYENKYNGQTLERVPGNFSAHEKKELERVATLVHQSLGMKHYSRSDFIVSKRGIYFLEINSAQAVGLTQESLLPKALKAVGTKFSDFLTHVVELARNVRPH
jgi:D-alanine-D-alanine ligase